MPVSPSSNRLPFYRRFGIGVSCQQGSLFSFRRGPFRFKEKYLILLTVIVIIFVCYSCIIFLPDGRDSGSVLVKKALRDVWSADPKALIVPPPRYSHEDEAVVVDDDGRGGGRAGMPDSRPVVRGGGRAHKLKDKQLDSRRIRDRKRLLEKIDQNQIPKPLPEGEQRQLLPAVPDQLPAATEVPKTAVRSAARIINSSAAAENDSETDKRRETVKQMMILAWDSYEKYAWGANELKPLSKVGHSASIFGSSELGATIVDALDTLYIMGLFDRYDKGRKWVEMSFSTYEMRGEVSVFETNIRFIGGFLACYALTNDELFVHRAAEIADLLLPAFDTPTGIPYALINTRTKKRSNYGWVTNGASILSEFGSMHLEFEYLSIITGRKIYREKVAKIRQVLDEIEKPDGLYPIYLHPKTRIWASRQTTMGALADSFYEYLLKSWLITNGRDDQAKRMYDETIDAMYNKMLQRSKNGLWYLAEWRGSYLDHKMEHLGCFAGGMFALQATKELNSTLSDRQLELGQQLGRTCHESYIRSYTHLGPESFRFSDDLEAEALNDRDKYYILRPEVIETYFYLWRTTKDRKYRDWAWDAVQALEKYCKSENGYSGIHNVYVSDPGKDDVQQSFFLAETLKYLYLIFSSDDVIPLDKWVFNTEAHPFPVRFDDQDHVIESFFMNVTTSQNGQSSITNSSSSSIVNDMEDKAAEIVADSAE